MPVPFESANPTASLLGEPATDLLFRIRGTNRHGQVVRLAGRKCSIGSGPQCTLRLRAPGVQPIHCLVLRGEQGTFVRRWTADTRLNGGPFSDAPLLPGDLLGIGPLELEVVDAALLREVAARSGQPTIAEPTFDDDVTLFDGELPTEKKNREVKANDGKLFGPAALERMQAALESTRDANRRCLGRLRETRRHLEDLDRSAADRQEAIRAFADRLAKLEKNPAAATGGNSANAPQLVALFDAVNKLNDELSEQRRQRGEYELQLRGELEAVRVALQNSPVPSVAAVTPVQVVAKVEEPTPAISPVVAPLHDQSTEFLRQADELAARAQVLDLRAEQLDQQAATLDARTKQLEEITAMWQARVTGPAPTDQAEIESTQPAAEAVAEVAPVIDMTGFEDVAVVEEPSPTAGATSEAAQELPPTLLQLPTVEPTQEAANTTGFEHLRSEPARTEFPLSRLDAPEAETSAEFATPEVPVAEPTPEPVAEQPAPPAEPEELPPTVAEVLARFGRKQDDPIPAATPHAEGTVGVPDWNHQVAATELGISDDNVRHTWKDNDFNAESDDEESPVAEKSEAASNPSSETNAPQADTSEFDPIVTPQGEAVADEGTAAAPEANLDWEHRRALLLAEDEQRRAQEEADLRHREQELMQQRHQEPTPAPAAAEPEAEGDSEESIEAYMARLLKRVGGSADSKPASSPSPSAPKPTQAPVASAQATPIVEEPKAVATPEPEVVPFTDASEFIPRAKAPEGASSLGAMRELANSSARSAIESSDKRRGGEGAIWKLAVALIGFVGAIVSWQFFGFGMIGLLGIGVGLSAAGYWGWMAWQHHQQTLAAIAAENAGTAAGAVVSETAEVDPESLVAREIGSDDDEL